MIEITGPWTRDRAAFDPGARVRTVQVDGHLFTVSNVSGPGWPMHIRPAFGDGARLHIHTARWEDWAEVERKAREFLATV
jgi:hypothetical protein